MFLWALSVPMYTPNGKIRHIYLIVSVGVRGFEPPTFSSRTRRATGLRHTPLRQLTARSFPGLFLKVLS